MTLGAEAVEYYDYDGEPLPYRPLRSWELDECGVNALRGASSDVVEIIIKTKLGIGLSDEINNLTPELYSGVLSYYDLYDYWIVYHAIKDFQEEDFQLPDEDGNPKGFNIIANEFKHVHDIASEVLSITSPPKKVIQELVKNKKGKILSTIHYHLNVPLASEQWKLTPLQIQFLEISKLDEIRSQNEAIQELENKRKGIATFHSGMSAKDYFKQIRNLRANAKHSRTSGIYQRQGDGPAKEREGSTSRDSRFTKKG